MNCTCNERFTDVEKLIVHLEYIHNCSSYICPFQFCRSSFHQRHSFRQHVIKVHNPVERNVSVTNTQNIIETYIPETTPKTNSHDILVTPNKSTLPVESSRESGVGPQESYNEVESLKDKFYESLLTSLDILMAKLYNNTSIPRSFIQETIQYFNCFLNSGMFEILVEIMKFLPDNYITSSLKLMVKNLEVSLSNFDTEFKRFKYFKSSKHFVEATPIKLGVTTEAQMKSGNYSLIVKHKMAYMMPIEYQMKTFLELPGVFSSVLNYQNKLINDKSLTMNNIVQGSIWKNNKMFKEGIVLPLLIYFDDFEIGNSLGSHAGYYKMGAIYYTIATIPPEYASRLENIFTALLFHSSDRLDEFGNIRLLEPLIEKLKCLETKGITLRNGVNIKFNVSLIIGDNLGVNSILGFTESFSSTYYCRLCLGTKESLKTQTTEDPKLIRDENDYENHYTNKLFGIKEECIWNSLSNFHVYKNITCDVMHDMFEGVLRYDMASIIYLLIKEGFSSLDSLNSKIKFAIYDPFETNIPPNIKLDNLKKGKIVMSSSEMFCLLRNFRFYVGNEVPENHEGWLLYLKILEITEIIMSSSITNDLLILLDTLISEHHEMYLRLLKMDLKPKHHFMVHYSRIIRTAGPPRFFSSIRFEAKHKEYKANVVNRKNIPMSLSIRNQLKFCHRVLSEVGLNDIINVGSIFSETFHNTDELKNYEYMQDNYYLSSWLERNGIKYIVGSIICSNLEEDMPHFLQIKYILVNKEIAGNSYFLCKNFVAVSFNSHYHAYEIDSQEILTLVPLEEFNGVFPCFIRTISNGDQYVALPLH